MLGTVTPPDAIAMRGEPMSDRVLLEIRVRLTRLASELAVARSERDMDRIAAEITRVRASLDDLLLMLPAA